MSDSELPSWLLKSKEWITCTFEGVGTKKQAYLELLAEGMAKRGFQRFKKITSKFMPTCLLISKKSDLIFKSPDKRVWIGIRALSKDEDLRIGFTYSDASVRYNIFSLASSIILGTFFCFLSAYIIGGGSLNSTGLPIWMKLLPVGIFFLAFLSGFVLFFGRPQITCRRRVKAILIETAESMGGKQITPFKWKTVELED